MYSVRDYRSALVSGKLFILQSGNVVRVLTRPSLSGLGPILDHDTSAQKLGFFEFHKLKSTVWWCRRPIAGQVSISLLLSGRKKAPQSAESLVE